LLKAMSKVPRHLFVPAEFRELAYADFPLSIGYGQTISQPYIVAYMTELLALQPTDKVLEVGTGSGYQTAILAELAGEIYTIEKVPELLESARELLTSLNYKNIHFHLGDGKLGWTGKPGVEYSFDKIIVTAAPRSLPEKLLAQLKPEGKMVIPIGTLGTQTLYLIEKNEGGKLDIIPKLPVAFVPLK